MITTKSNGSLATDVDSLFALPVDPAACRLADLIVQLIRHLEHLKVTPPSDEDRECPDRWNDEDFTYLEAKLPGTVDGEIDINVHGGRVYVRLVR